MTDSNLGFYPALPGHETRCMAFSQLELVRSFNSTTDFIAFNAIVLVHNLNSCT
ncbi:hypothetical protein H1P_1620002 [Hyella patelloides LEGE 07179]|uniref:Uncharacterized protein n=1 Tax=Hyella patelloides LEGE 07179 TaxID=945734 RepID=A0A563VMQ6_9CYAN|nr:hypothetical protein [Hyella patelloides]VEP12736.1 hypothetical protein H1P_1620002 [Hyella patelloides LEGE 07179]